jgi:hypothetical protein
MTTRAAIGATLAAALLAFGCEAADASDQTDDGDDNGAAENSYSIVGTNQTIYYDDAGEIGATSPGDDYYGQNANHPGAAPSYTDNGDGTVTDNVTGLTWTKAADADGDGSVGYADKLTFQEAVDRAATLRVGGYDDWRLPTIKELYSLIVFSGVDASGQTTTLVPFIDTDYFDFAYGDESEGERLIDAQYVSATSYADYTMNGDPTVFGVNFADGRIKGYPKSMPDGSEKLFYAFYVREGAGYGENSFTDNGDGTITDNATGLMWAQADNGAGLDWKNALAYAESAELAGYDDWRLPDAKELQSVVDYSRSPATSASAAIDPIFDCTQITNEAGETDYPYYWTSTTHVNGSTEPGGYACYLSFGRALGNMRGSWLDVHGAGAQRSDPKAGDPADYPNGHGPQGDAIRIENYVRLVRDAE